MLSNHLSKRKILAVSSMALLPLLLLPFFGKLDEKSATGVAAQQRAQAPGTQPSQPAFVTLLAHRALSNHLARTLLPMTLDITQQLPQGSPQTLLTLVDLTSCGGSGTDSNLLAILYPGPAPGMPPTPLLASNGCATGLSALAQQAIDAAGAPDWLAVIKISASWAPWELKLAVKSSADVVAINKTGKPPAPQATVAALQNLGTFKTLGLGGIKTTLAQAQEASFHLGIRFIGTDTEITLVPSERLSEWSAPSGSGTVVDLTGAPASANAVAVIPHSYSNYFRETYYKTPIMIGQAGDQIPLENLHVSGGSAGTGDFNADATATRIIKFGSQDVPVKFQVTALFQEDDLKLKKITIRNLTNSPATLKVLADQLAASFTQKFTKDYQGQPLRPLGVRTLLPINVGAKKLMLRLIVEKARSTPDALYFYGAFQLETP